MAEFSKVSLGFAEFVSQLLHETFDAVLSAQNYQLEKYSALEKALGISTRDFRESFVNDDEIKEKEVELFGAPLSENMIIPDDLLSRVKELVPDFGPEMQDKAIRKGKLTSYGVTLFADVPLESLVAEKKGEIRQLVNHSDMVRLIVDSGEIRAKLELTNLYQSTDTEPVRDDDPKKEPPPELSDPPGKGATVKPASGATPTLKRQGLKEIKMKEIEDPVSKQKTLIIDKASVQKSATFAGSMPNVRLIATPATSTSNSNLFSEVIIKFKTI